MKRSTGFRNHVLATGSVKSALDGKVIKVYAGTEPASADDAIGSATLLVTISVNGTGTGVTMNNSASGGQLSKNPSEVWKGVIATSGTAAFFRMETAADTGSASTSAIRLQGNIALDGADLNFATLELVATNERAINYFTVSLPAG